MSVRDIAEFRADFPDDSIEEEGGFVRYPGLSVAEAVAQKFRDMRFQVPAPESEMELGWVLDVHVGKRQYWFRLTDVGDHIILISRDMTRYEPTPGDIGHEDLLGRIDTAMKADERFSNIAWYTEAEYQRLGEESAKRLMITMPLSQRPSGGSRAAIFICAALVLTGFAAVEFWTGLGFFADRRMAIAGLHALAGGAALALCFWGIPRLGMWLYSRGF